MAQNSTPFLQTRPHQVTCAPSISTSHSPHTTTCSTASYLNNFLLPPQWPLTHSFHSITPMSPAFNAHLPLPATCLGRSRLHRSSRSRATLATPEQTLHLLPASCSCHGTLPQHTVGHSGAQSSLFEGSEEYTGLGARRPRLQTEALRLSVCGASGKSLPLWASASPLETLSNISWHKQYGQQGQQAAGTRSS